MTTQVYSYAKCGTCRKALQWLDARGVRYAVVPIREQPPALAELRQMLARYDGNVRRLFNASGGDYKAMNLSKRLPRMSEAEALALLAKHGNLVKRPFVLTAKSGAVGFNEGEWNTLFPVK